MGIDLNSAPDSFRKRIPDAERKAMGKYGWTKEECQERYEAGKEKELQEEVAAWLDIEGIYYSRSRMDRRTTVRVGTPDFLCSVDGIFLAIECKTQYGKMTTAQAKEMEAISASKGRTLLAYNLPSVISAVRGIQAEMRYVRETLKREGWKLK